MRCDVKMARTSKKISNCKGTVSIYIVYRIVFEQIKQPNIVDPS